MLTLSKIFQMYWRSRNLSALYVWLFGPFTPVNSKIDRGDTVQQALEKAQGQIDDLLERIEILEGDDDDS